MTHPPSLDDGHPPFDTLFARELVGKCVLVGITQGQYRLRSTGEVVSDPDFIARWTVTRRDA